ncbi:MAG: hypothetical protein P3T54_06080 [Dehalogenimonas sp.]|uniref:Type 4a pilus biogenesis protein PilO n=1 Tax=Candidatus Dehalogenimonas loeffleri TaxID=3127115 RepID=A0ABZ2J4W9_9CHLR|nr:hypothetical protein [Dehalogenimonas sp.]
MKISKPLIVVLFLGIIAIGAGMLYMLWQDERDREAQLNASLDTTQALLPVVQDGVTSAEDELTAAEAKLAETQARMTAARAALDEFIAKFPTPIHPAAIQTIDYGTRLFIRAANHSLNLVEFNAEDFSTITIDKIRYQSTSFVFHVTGNIENINNFIGSLETVALIEPYLTVTIDSVQIEIYHEYDPEIAAVPSPEATIAITLMALEDN